MVENRHLDYLLKNYAHSATCTRKTCNPFCKMFKKVRAHVTAGGHDCELVVPYTVLLKLHVERCKSNLCGLPACPIIKQKYNLHSPCCSAQEKSIIEISNEMEKMTTPSQPSQL